MPISVSPNTPRSSIVIGTRSLPPTPQVSTPPKAPETAWTPGTVKKQVQQSQTRTSSMRGLTDPSQGQKLGQQLATTSSAKLNQQSQKLNQDLKGTGFVKRLSQRSQSLVKPLTHAKVVLKTADETVNLFNQVKKSPDPQNIYQLGKSVGKFGKSIEKSIHDMPGGPKAIMSAKNKLGKLNPFHFNPLKPLTSLPIISSVFNTVKDGSRAYKDIHACIQNPSLVNISRALCSSVKFAATTTVAVTTALALTEIVPFPVSVPILAIGATVSGIAGSIHSHLPPPDPPKSQSQTDPMAPPSGTPGAARRQPQPKQPNLQNLSQLGSQIDGHQKSIEKILSGRPGGSEAIRSAQKFAGHVNSVKELTAVPQVDSVVSTVKDGSKAYKDLHKCWKEPSLMNVCKSLFSSLRFGGKCTVSVTQGLSTLGIIPKPVTEPVLMVGNSVSDLSSKLRKWMG